MKPRKDGTPRAHTRFHYRNRTQVLEIIGFLIISGWAIERWGAIQITGAATFFILYDLFWRPYRLTISDEGIVVGFVLRPSIRLTVSGTRLDVQMRRFHANIRVFSPRLIRRFALMRMPVKAGELLDSAWRELSLDNDQS